ncbi:MAG: fumarate hydratase [Candidatus Hydrothermarchaeota archaeon]
MAITREDVIDSVEKILREAVIKLPEDVIFCLKSSLKKERNERARATLNTILENVRVAAERNIPMCQDTGIPIFFVDLGRDLNLDFDLKEAITEGVRKATKEIPLRPNAVHPLTRENSGDNTGPGMPDITLDLVEGSSMKITVAPKGAGSENMSALRMLSPGQAKEVDRIIVETVKNAGGRPCPPVIVGVGIGGSFDESAKLAKKAILRDLREKPSKMEKEVLEKINSLGIGPMGLGGNTTALKVNIEFAHCHTASLPLAINIQCWADRKASVVLGG